MNFEVEGFGVVVEKIEIKLGAPEQSLKAGPKPQPMHSLNYSSQPGLSNDKLSWLVGLKKHKL